MEIGSCVKCAETFSACGCGSKAAEDAPVPADPRVSPLNKGLHTPSDTPEMAAEGVSKTEVQIEMGDSSGQTEGYRNRIFSVSPIDEGEGSIDYLLDDLETLIEERVSGWNETYDLLNAESFGAEDDYSTNCECEEGEYCEDTCSVCVQCGIRTQTAHTPFADERFWPDEDKEERSKAAKGKDTWYEDKGCDYCGEWVLNRGLNIFHNEPGVWNEATPFGDKVFVPRLKMKSFEKTFGAEKVNFVILGSKDIEGVGIVTEGSPYLKNYYGEMDEYNIYDDDAAEEIMSIPVNDPRYPLKKGEMRLIEAMVYGFNHPRINDSRGELNEDGMFWAGMVMETLANYSDSPAESFGAETDEEKCSKCENVFDESEYFPIECVVCEQEVCKECSSYQRDENDEWDWDKPTCFDCLYPDQEAESFAAYGHKGLIKLYGISGDVKIESTVRRILADINEGQGFADDEYYYLTEEERDEAYDDMEFYAEDDIDFDEAKADRNKDGRISDWERAVGNKVAKGIRESKRAEVGPHVPTRIAATTTPRGVVKTYTSIPAGDGHVVGQFTPDMDYAPSGMYGAESLTSSIEKGFGAVLGIMSGLIVGGFAMGAVSSLSKDDENRE